MLLLLHAQSAHPCSFPGLMHNNLWNRKTWQGHIGIEVLPLMSETEVYPVWMPTVADTVCAFMSKISSLPPAEQFKFSKEHQDNDSLSHTMWMDFVQTRWNST